MTSKTFTLMATVTASTKRPPAISGSKRGTPVANITSLVCFPLDPVDSEVRARMGTQGPMELLQTFTQGGLDIQEGDLLVVSSTEYIIRSVGNWTWPLDSADYLHLVIEEIKTT